MCARSDADLQACSQTHTHTLVLSGRYADALAATQAANEGRALNQKQMQDAIAAVNAELERERICACVRVCVFCTWKYLLCVVWV